VHINTLFHQAVPDMPEFRYGVDSFRGNGETAAMLNQDIHEAVLEFESDELDACDPLRSKMRPTDAEGFREAWTIVVQLWEDTVERARTLPPVLLHESVNGEWSFIETLRHLLFATDSWIGRVLLGDPNPWHALDLRILGNLGEWSGAQ
jgi:DinB superfamily